MNGMAYVVVPFNNRQSWQNSGGSGPYHTRNKSNPLTNDEFVACCNSNILLRMLLTLQDVPTSLEYAKRSENSEKFGS